MSPRARDVIASRGRKSRSGPGARWPTSFSAHQQWRMQQARIQLRFSGGRKYPFWGSFWSLVASQSEERGERSCWNFVSGPTTWICHRNGRTMMTLNMASWHERCPAGGFHIHRPSRRHGKPTCAAFHKHRWWMSSSIWEPSVAGRMVVWDDIKTTGATYFTSPVMLLTWSWLPLTISPMYGEPARHRLDWVGSRMIFGFCWLKMEKLSPGNARVRRKYIDFGPNNCWIFIVYTYPGRPWRVCLHAPGLGYQRPRVYTRPNTNTTGVWPFAHVSLTVINECSVLYKDGKLRSYYVSHVRVLKVFFFLYCAKTFKHIYTITHFWD